MASGGECILSELKDLVNQIGPCPEASPCAASPQPCCPPCTFPYVQVTMTCPPPCLAPTYPQPVKPLQLPCPNYSSQEELTPDRKTRFRVDNYYNNYNVDWHPESPCDRNNCPAPPQTRPERCCEDYTKNKNSECCKDAGCPTGFKPCQMKLTPPPCCDPCGIWFAQVQPCPPKPKKKWDNTYVPGPCTRPCCKHWKPKEGPCLYDDPCKAHCYNHPVGIKPSGRYP